MAVTTDVSTTGQDDYSYGAVIQPDGKIVLGGVSGAGDCALVRYTANGGLDTSFGTGGKIGRASCRERVSSPV